jgi:hypothetical protein
MEKRTVAIGTGVCWIVVVGACGTRGADTPGATSATAPASAAATGAGGSGGTTAPASTSTSSGEGGMSATASTGSGGITCKTACDCPAGQVCEDTGVCHLPADCQMTIQEGCRVEACDPNGTKCIPWEDRPCTKNADCGVQVDGEFATKGYPGQCLNGKCAAVTFGSCTKSADCDAVGGNLCCHGKCFANDRCGTEASGNKCPAGMACCSYYTGSPYPYVTCCTACQTSKDCTDPVKSSCDMGRCVAP